MKKYILTLLATIAVIAAARLSFYTVDAAEYAYVTVLGKHTQTLSGADAQGGAGLHLGWPWPIQQVQRVDRRLQQFDLGEFEQLTHDKKTVDKNLLIEAYVCWKIPSIDAVGQFVQSFNSFESAKDYLSKTINSKLGALIGQKSMNDLVSTDDDPKTGAKLVDATAKALRTRLLEDVREEAKKYGIDVVDIRLRRFNHPSSVRDSIYQRIRTERAKEAAKYLSEGDRLASDILARTESEVRESLAKARSAEERIKAEADIEAMKTRNEAYSQDPEFYAFLKKMEKLQSIVGDQKTMLLLSTHRPLFESLFNPPRPKAEGNEKKKAP